MTVLLLNQINNKSFRFLKKNKKKKGFLKQKFKEKIKNKYEFFFTFLSIKSKFIMSLNTLVKIWYIFICLK